MSYLYHKKMIHKLVSILISGLILTQSFNVGVNDIVQLDELIEHAKFHADEYGDNFVVFISKHYGELKQEHNKEHQEEKEEHEQLPFQHQGHTNSFLAVVTNDNKSDYNKIEEQKNSSTIFFYQSPDYNCHLSGIFQPPRQA